MRAASRTDTGRVRTNNEDSLLVDESRDLYILADGMGGALGGEVASALAVDTVLHQIACGLATGSPEEDVPALLAKSVTEAHQAGLAGMGTTIVVALRRGAGLYIAHVGDSRAYLIRQGAIRQLTEDQTVVAELVREGAITGAEARTHRLRHVLSQALGAAPDLKPSMQILEPRNGDHVILCSDGLTEMLGDEALLNAVREHDADLDAACAQLVDRANEAGGRDNISVILLAEESPNARGQFAQ
jgi:serine/threonine protein phosphatase PrpC